MKLTQKLAIENPQYVVTTDITYAQVDSWYGHSRRDLKMDLIYPEDMEGRTYPCIVWICGGGWLRMDKSAHLAYLAQLARKGFAVASVEYRTSNEGSFPMQLVDVKSAIRYLKAHAERYRINPDAFGVMGESAGGYLTCMAALDMDASLEVGDYLEQSSQVQAACPWYPPTDLATFPHENEKQAAASPESLMMGFSVMDHSKEAKENSPVSKVTPDAPPFFIIHGNEDKTVPFSQSEELYEVLEKAGCDVTLLALDGADHADLMFFQEKVWEQIAEFFIRTLVENRF